MDKKQAAREGFETLVKVVFPGSNLERYPDDYFLGQRGEYAEYRELRVQYAWELHKAAQSALMPVLVEARDALKRAAACQFQRYYSGVKFDGTRGEYLAGDDDAEYAVKQSLARLNTCIGEK